MPATLDISAVRLRIRGRVQGVGFRPFVCGKRLARTHSAWPAGKSTTLRGRRSLIHIVAAALSGELEIICNWTHFRSHFSSPRQQVESLEQEQATSTGTTSFQILTQPDTHPNQRLAVSRSRVPSDRATCDICLEDILNPTNQHFHRYPFTTCTVCGPRYSILERLPYERRYTSMCGFPLCSRCAREFDDSANRRFHAEPIACQVCGPPRYLPSRECDAWPQVVNPLLWKPPRFCARVEFSPSKG